MGQVWFTADLHLGHGNIIRYCMRPFMFSEEETLAKADPRGSWKISPETLQRHDNALLDAINRVVDKTDTLWILGDFCWGKLEIARAYRERILCKNVHLVWGNHDHQSVKPLFSSAIDQGLIRVEKEQIWLNHYPMRSWNKRFHGTWHLYGHVHGRLSAEDTANPSWLTKDVGVDASGYRPWSFDEIASYMNPRVEQFKRQKSELLQSREE
jgi:calcineurin-like phosphoesterase family protein